MSIDDIVSKDYSREPVLIADSRSIWSLISVFVAMTVCISALILGAQIGLNSSVQDTIIGSVLGGLLLSFIGVLMAHIGSDTKLSLAMISNFTFGNEGSKIISFVLVLTLFGWFGVQTEVFADSLNNLLKEVFNINLPRLSYIFFGGLLMSSTAIIGFKALEKLSMVAVPLLIVLILLPFINIYNSNGLSNVLEYQSKNVMSLANIISLVGGSFIVGALIMPDIMRYAKSNKDARFATFFGFSIFYPIFLTLTAIIAISVNELDVIKMFLMVGLGVPALIILIVASWTTNDSNLYSSSLGLSVIFKSYSKPVLAASAGAIGTICAAMGILEYFIPWLIFLGLIIAPVGGVIIADYFMDKKAYSFNKLESVTKFRHYNLIAWIFGVLGGVMTTPKASNGLELFEFTSISSLDGIILSACFVFLYRQLKCNKFNK